MLKASAESHGCGLPPTVKVQLARGLVAEAFTEIVVKDEESTLPERIASVTRGCRVVGTMHQNNIKQHSNLSEC